MQCIPHSVHSFKWKKVEIEHNQTEINITKLSLIHLYLHVLYTTHHIDILQNVCQYGWWQENCHASDPNERLHFNLYVFLMTTSGHFPTMFEGGWQKIMFFLP